MQLSEQIQEAPILEGGDSLTCRKKQIRLEEIDQSEGTSHIMEAENESNEAFMCDRG